MNLQEKYYYLKKDVEKRKKLHKAYKKQERKLKLAVCAILNEEINSRNFAVSNSIYKSEYKPKKNEISTLWQTFFVVWLAITLGFLLFKLGVQ